MATAHQPRRPLSGTAATGRRRSCRSPRYIGAAVADPARPAPQVELDALRKPAEVIAFSGLRPGTGSRISWRANAYFTRIFSRVVGARGRVYAFLQAQELATCEPQETAGTKALDRMPLRERARAHRRRRSVWPSRNPSTWCGRRRTTTTCTTAFMAPTDIARLNQAIFRALRPGGTFIVIDHVAPPARGCATRTLNRIDPQSIIAEVTAEDSCCKRRAHCCEPRGHARTAGLRRRDPARHRSGRAQVHKAIGTLVIASDSRSAPASNRNENFSRREPAADA